MIYRENQEADPNWRDKAMQRLNRPIPREVTSRSKRDKTSQAKPGLNKTAYGTSKPSSAQKAALPRHHRWIDVPRDGNCFYHCVARGLQNRGNHADIRQMTANYASHPHPEEYNNPIYLANNRGDNGTNETANAIAQNGNYTGLADSGPHLAARALEFSFQVIEENGSRTHVNYNPNDPANPDDPDGPRQAPDLVLARAHDHFFLMERR